MEYIAAKSILSGYKEQPGWFGCHYNMNLYRGCSHGCIYCDSRSECYGIEDFDRVRAKENALVILEKELGSRRRLGIIHTGSMSDPYNPAEREENLTSRSLSLIARYGYGVVMATKSDLVVRDIALLQKIAQSAPAAVNITITTADDELAKKLEPAAPVSSRRFAAIQALSSAGVTAGVLLMPVLPFIEDTPENIENIVKLAAGAGAKYIFNGGRYVFGVTMRDRQRAYFYQKIEEIYPGMAKRYQGAYGSDYSCQSPEAARLWRVYTNACEEYGIEYRMSEIVKIIAAGWDKPQLSWF